MPSSSDLRPIERRLLWWQSRGFTVEELAPKFRRSPEHLQRILKLIDLKQQPPFQSKLMPQVGPSYIEETPGL